jgi:taurine transport system ATP-binding protein
MEKQTPSCIAVQQVSQVFESKGAPVHALQDISLEAEQGCLLCVVGPSGCGKTTLLRLLAGFIFPTQGRVLINGMPVQGPDCSRGVVFQKPNLYPWLTMRENVAFGPRMRRLDDQQTAQRVDHCLNMIKLTDMQERYPAELSGGMQQRVAIARVLANDSEIMLMDEPFGALDALTREHMQEELLAIWRQTRRTIFFITHSVEEAVYLGTRVLVMSPRPGRIVAEFDCPFSRRAVNRAACRAVKSMPEFVEFREKVLSYIWDQE